ncbi:MAG: hypothetical protein ACR2OD_06710 [Gaiellaceae bacterium]
MAMPRSQFDAAHIKYLAELTGLELQADDAEAVAAALAGHCEMMASLFAHRLENEPVAPTYDPRWRG